MLLVAAVYAHAQTVNFEGQPDSTIVTNQYPGLVFSNTIILTSGISLNEFEFPPRSGANVASDNNGPVTINFTTPVSSFLAYFTYSQPLTMQAFNAANALVSTVSSKPGCASNMALSGTPGCLPNEQLSVSSGAGIAKVVITGNPAGTSFTMDDLSYLALQAPPGNAPAVIQTDVSFQVRYVANLNVADSLINITNTGNNGASLTGPGFGPVGNMCVNVYGFSPDEQLVSCCSCLITPNGLISLSVYDSIRSNTLTGVTPNSMVIKLVATGAGPTYTGTNCAGSAGAAGSAAFPTAVGMAAWATSTHVPGAGAVPAAVAPFRITETPFTPATLSTSELASLSTRCSNIIGNGSGFGICRSCQSGGRGASRP